MFGVINKITKKLHIINNSDYKLVCAASRGNYSGCPNDWVREKVKYILKHKAAKHDGETSYYFNGKQYQYQLKCQNTLMVTSNGGPKKFDGIGDEREWFANYQLNYENNIDIIPTLFRKMTYKLYSKPRHG